MSKISSLSAVSRYLTTQCASGVCSSVAATFVLMLGASGCEFPGLLGEGLISRDELPPRASCHMFSVPQARFQSPNHRPQRKSHEGSRVHSSMIILFLC